MKKIVKLGLICSFCFSLSFNFSFASQIDNNIEVTTEINTTIQNNNDETSTIIENNNKLNEQETIKQQITETTQKEEKEDKLTKSWINIIATNENIIINKGKHFSVTLVLENLETQELIKETLSTENNLSKVFIIPNGQYKVYIEEKTVTAEHCIMEDTLIADGGEIDFNITFKNLKAEIINPELNNVEDIPMWKLILKNNMVFLTLITGCSIYLIIKKIKKAYED